MQCIWVQKTHVRFGIALCFREPLPNQTIIHPQFNLLNPWTKNHQSCLHWNSPIILPCLKWPLYPQSAWQNKCTDPQICICFVPHIHGCRNCGGHLMLSVWFSFEKCKQWENILDVMFSKTKKENIGSTNTFPGYRGNIIYSY